MDNLIKREWEGDGMKGAATFSPCEQYRYTLCRMWGRGSVLPVIMLNPSTATEELLDPTIRRVIGFAKREGYTGVVVGNIFAFRATKPLAMKAALDPIGPENDRVMRDLAMHAKVHRSPILCGWGRHGDYRNRCVEVANVFNEVDVRAVCLGETGNGQPKHPLYIKADQPFVDWKCWVRNG